MKLWNSTLVQFAIEFSPTIVHSFGIVSRRFRSVIQPHHNAMGKQTKWKLLRFRVGCVRTATWQVCDKYPATGNLWQIFLYQVHLLPLRISHSVVCVVAERLTSYSIDERGKVVDRWIAFGFIYSFSLHDKMVFFSANSPQTAKRTMCGNVHWICVLNTYDTHIPNEKLFAEFKMHECIYLLWAFFVVIFIQEFSFYCSNAGANARENIRKRHCSAENVCLTKLAREEMPTEREMAIENKKSLCTFSHPFTQAQCMCRAQLRISGVWCMEQNWDEQRESLWRDKFPLNGSTFISLGCVAAALV